MLNRVREHADELGRATAELEACGRALELLNEVPTLNKSHVAKAIQDAFDEGKLSPEQYRRFAPELDARGVGAILPRLSKSVQDRVKDEAAKDTRLQALAVPMRADGSLVSKSDVANMLSTAFHAGLVSKEKFTEFMRQLDVAGLERTVARLPKKLRARLGLAD